MAFLSSWTSKSMPGRPSFFFLRASRMSSGTIPLILSSSLVSWSSLTRAAVTMAVVVLEMPAWQLKMTGQGCGVLEHGDNLVKVSLNGGLLLVGGDPQGLELGHLLLDGGVDLIEGGDTGQLLSDLLIICSLLGMLSELILEELDVISPLLDLLGKGFLQGGDVLRVVHLKMKVDVVGVSGGERLAINVDNGLLPEVNPEDVFLISVLLEDGLKALLETIDRGLACAEDGKARKPSEVGSPIGLGGALGQSVNALKGIYHSHQGVHCGGHLV